MGNGTVSVGWTERWTITAGFAGCVICGVIGKLWLNGTAKNIIYAIASVGVLAGAALLGAVHAKADDVPGTAGLLLLAVAVAGMWTGSFAGGTMVLFVALILAGLSGGFPIWARVASALSGLAFGVHTVRWLSGTWVYPGSKVVSAACILLAIAFLGRISSIWSREGPKGGAPTEG